MATLDNLLDQALDIAGTLFQTDNLVIADEASQLGRRLNGQDGYYLSIGGIAPEMVLTGMTGMTSESIGRFITIFDADSSANNGTFLVIAYNSETSVTVYNALGVTGDANNGVISWIERYPWMAEDDHNFHRTDRAAIKGTNYNDAVPTYYKVTDKSTAIAANLSNIAGNTTDAKSFITDHKFENVTILENDGYITLTDLGQLKHADAIDETGVPIFDGIDAGNYESCYVEIIADGYESGLVVLSGINAGHRIFGITRAGSSSSPDTVEVELRSVAIDQPISTSVSYEWESEQPSIVDIYYPFRDALNTMDENAFRKTLVHGLVADAGLAREINEVKIAIGINFDDTDLSSHLTNTGIYYPFYNLPDATPTVVEALNTLNEQIGSRDYEGTILTDGYTISASLQEIANAIENGTGSSVINRTIERVTSNINAGTEHTLPGGLSYQQDGTNNGNYMSVYWRKQLMDPGTLIDGDDYEETSSTSITPYSRIRSGDHINYFIKTVA